MVVRWLTRVFGRCSGVTLCVVLGVVAAQAHAADAVQTHWMETRLSDVPTGFLRERVDARADGAVRTEIESRVVLNRMESQVEIRSLASYEESADGSLQRVSAKVGSSAETTALEGEVIDGALRLRSTAGGRDYETVTPLPSPLLGPQGIHARSRDTLRRVGDRAEYATFLGEYSSIVQVTREVTGTETLSIDGKDVPVVLVRETLDVMPVPMHLWLDADGRALRLRQDSPFGLIESMRSDAGVVDRVAAGAELPEETYSNAVAKSNIRLPQPRSLERVQLRIDLKREGSVMPVFDPPHQRVLERGERHAVVEIRRGAVDAKARDEESDGAQWLVPNAYLQSDHPDVRALAESLRRPGADRYTQMRALQDWVTTQMDFDAGIALVSASEAVRDRRGTCMAYAVVLTTLARALDMPSRVVMGYIYAANMWGGHAWAEVLIDGQWVAFDSAVWRDGTADPARIGVLRTSLEQGTASGIAALSQLYGNERVTVQEYTLDGRTVRVPGDAVSYVVSDREYSNEWLGITLRAPAGFTIAESDIMYPRSEIVVLRDAAGREIAIEQRAVGPGEAEDVAGFLRTRDFDVKRVVDVPPVGDRPVLLVDNDARAAAVWLDGSDIWYVRGQGDGIADAVRELVRSVKLPMPDGVALRTD